MCEKDHIDSYRVLTFMQTAGEVTDNLTTKKAHLVVSFRPCVDCSSRCCGFIMNGDWHGLNQDEMEKYREQIHNFSKSQFIPG